MENGVVKCTLGMPTSSGTGGGGAGGGRCGLVRGVAGVVGVRGAARLRELGGLDRSGLPSVPFRLGNGWKHPTPPTHTHTHTHAHTSCTQVNSLCMSPKNDTFISAASVRACVWGEGGARVGVMGGEGREGAVST